MRHGGHDMVSRGRWRLAAAAVLLMLASTPGYAKDGRVHLTLVKAGATAGGTGILFYDLRKYGLKIGGIDSGKLHARRTNLVGTASNLESTADIVGTYAATDANHAVAGRGKMAELKNSKGVVLELYGVNLDGTLDLNGLTIVNSGWQTHPE
jgi:hypothetical protein